MQGIAYVREQPAGQRPDVFWASAPDAFEVLAGQKLLDNMADLANKAVPAKVGNYPINDPKGFYLGQALAGYGLMWNTRYMAANKLPEPKEWADLTKPVYFGHVAIARRRARAPRTSRSRPSCRAKAGTRAGRSCCRSPATAPPSPSAASACPTASTTASSASAW